MSLACPYTDKCRVLAPGAEALPPAKNFQQIFSSQDVLKGKLLIFGLNRGVIGYIPDKFVI